MDIDALKAIGFGDKEATIYLTLLQIGSAPASKVAKELGMDRTTVYYILLRMLEQGLVNQTIKGRTKRFAATDPKTLYEERIANAQRFSAILPALQAAHNQHKEELAVEVRQGNAGLRFLYKDSISRGGEVLGFGVDDSQYVDMDDTGLQQYYRDAKANGMKERIITYKGAFIVGNPLSEYRYVDKKFFQPTPIFVYKNTLGMITFVPRMYLIFIRSKELADAFRKHFELLWSIAKPLRQKNQGMQGRE